MNNSEKVGRILIVLGIVIIAMGLLFAAQSRTIVGPTSSFMYDNPEWTVNGSLIAASGLMVGSIGFALQLYSKRAAKLSQ